MSGIRYSQIDTVASEFEGAGTDSRQLSIKAGGVSEGKLGFSWNVVEIPASSFSYTATRSTYDLTPEPAASSNGNVTDFATLLENGVDNKTLVALTAAEDEFSLSGTTLSIHGDITGTGATYKLRYITGTASGEASTSGNQIWLGTIQQAPPQTETDYFTDDALDPKWEEWDVPGNLTVSENAGEVVLSAPDASGDYKGIVQDAPADNQFVVTAKVRISSRYGAASALASLIVGEDLSVGGGAQATSSFFNNQMLHNASGRIWESTTYSNYNTFSAQNPPAGGKTTFQDSVYLRWFVDRTAGVSGDVTALLSWDGRTWLRYAPVALNGSVVSAIDSIGIAILNSGSGGAAEVACEMFRVDITTDPELPVGGYVGTSVASTFDNLRDVAVAPASTLDLYGWMGRRAKLIKCEVFCTTVATVGAYTLALTKDPNGSAVNMLSAATFDLTTSGTVTAYTPTDVPLTSTVDNIILDVGDVWEASFVSDNAGLDAEGVYFQLTWLVL